MRISNQQNKTTNSASPLSSFVRHKRKEAGLTQQELADKAGVGLRFVRELENHKPTLQLEKVNQVLRLFGFEVGPVPFKRNVESL
jgi:y4mF family transcriptional regulator